jgi:hypothetical protein
MRGCLYRSPMGSANSPRRRIGSAVCLRRWKIGNLVSQIDKVLAHPDLANFLRVVEDHNIRVLEEHKIRALEERIGNRSPFLLAPYLFQVVHAVTERKATVARMPALERRPAELRSHYQGSVHCSLVLLLEGA